MTTKWRRDDTDRRKSQDTWEGNDLGPTRQPHRPAQHTPQALPVFAVAHSATPPLARRRILGSRGSILRMRS